LVPYGTDWNRRKIGRNQAGKRSQPIPALHGAAHRNGNLVPLFGASGFEPYSEASDGECFVEKRKREKDTQR
jgi:hypothetical protein